MSQLKTAKATATTASILVPAFICMLLACPALGQEPGVTKSDLDGLQERAAAQAKSINTSPAQEQTQEQAKGINPNPAQELAREQAKSMKVADRPENPEGKMPDQAQLQEQVQKELARQGQDVFAPLNKGNPFAEPQVSKQQPLTAKSTPKPIPMSGERLYILVSSSLPETVLRNYLADAGRIRDARVEVAIRGLVGTMPQTLAWSRKMILKDPQCPMSVKCKELWPLSINPNPFRAFGLDHVPAIAWAKAPARGQSFAEDEFVVVRGDVSLAYALEKLSQHPQATEFAQGLLGKLKQPKP